MKKTFVFQAAVVVAALAMVNVACSRGGKSNNDNRVGAVGPADKPAPTTAEILDGVFRNLEATFKSDRNSISNLIEKASVGKSMTDSSANGAIGTPISTFKASLKIQGTDEVLDFTGDSTSLTAMKEGQIIMLQTKQAYDSSQIGEALTVKAQCMDKCERVAVLVLSFKKEGYKMDSKPNTAGIIFVSKPGEGYVIEHSLTPIEKLQPKAPVQTIVEGPQADLSQGA